MCEDGESLRFMETKKYKFNIREFDDSYLDDINLKIQEKSLQIEAEKKHELKEHQFTQILEEFVEVEQKELYNESNFKYVEQDNQEEDIYSENEDYVYKEMMGLPSNEIIKTIPQEKITSPNLGKRSPITEEETIAADLAFELFCELAKSTTCSRCYEAIDRIDHFKGGQSSVFVMLANELQNSDLSKLL